MIDRRTFLASLGALPASLTAQERTPEPQRVEAFTAPPKPAIALNHAGFKPDAPKTVIYRLTGGDTPTEFEIREIGHPPIPFHETMPLRPAKSELGDCLTGDFSSVKLDGLYQVRIGEERSVPFFINREVWHRTIPRAFNYYPLQRCGIAVPNVHPVCHLDDAFRTDNGEYVDTTGGWHDAGDLRKWLGTTMLSATALLTLDRNLGDRWNLDGSGRQVILDEVKWGNRYILKMQDTDGRIWHDVAGNPGNEMNHWTDNILGTKDDRNLAVNKPNAFQAQWVVVQAMVEQAFRDVDPGYGRNCLARAHACWNASKPGGEYREISWWTFAAMEMHRATGDAKWSGEAAALARRVMAMQNREHRYGQKLVRGWWHTSEENDEPYFSRTTQSAMAPLALAKMAETFPSHRDARKWKDAVRLHLDEYVMPLVERSAYLLMPEGVFAGSPTPERYRPLAGELTYRFFMPVRRQQWWLGTTSHIGGYAALLAAGARMFGDRAYSDVAVRQLEWLLGANPFAASLMTGVGLNQPYPHSRFVGLIDGAIMNGIAGNADDEPVLDTKNGYDWRTTEYWQPHNAWFLWVVSELERPA